MFSRDEEVPGTRQPKSMHLTQRELATGEWGVMPLIYHEVHKTGGTERTWHHEKIQDPLELLIKAI